MSSGKLRTFTRGKATSLPQQGAAPQSEAWRVDAPQPKAATKRFSPAALIGRPVPDGNAAPGPAVPPDTGFSAAAAPVEGASLRSVVDSAAANSGVKTIRPEAPAVRLRRLAGVALWALVLVLAGVASAIVGLFHVFGDSPSWFTPAFISCGVVGMMLAMMAFATVRFRGVPWMFMAASSITLLAAFMMLRIA